MASGYPHYVAKVEKKSRTREERKTVIRWLSGSDESELSPHLDAGTTFEQFFAASRLNENAALMRSRIPGR